MPTYRQETFPTANGTLTVTSLSPDPEDTYLKPPPAPPCEDEKPAKPRPAYLDLHPTPKSRRGQR